MTAAGCAEDLDTPGDESSIAQGLTDEQAAATDDAPTLSIDGVPASDGSQWGILTADGWWMGSPVAVKIHVSGTGLFVGEANAQEKWVGDNGSLTGHTEIYSVSPGGATANITNNPRHSVSRAGGARSTYSTPNRFYADGSKICARFWYQQGGQWHHLPSSCVNIHD